MSPQLSFSGHFLKTFTYRPPRSSGRICAVDTETSRVRFSRLIQFSWVVFPVDGELSTRAVRIRIPAIFCDEREGEAAEIGGGGAQRPVFRVHDPNKTGARSPWARGAARPTSINVLILFNTSTGALLGDKYLQRATLSNIRTGTGTSRIQKELARTMLRIEV